MNTDIGSPPTMTSSYMQMTLSRRSLNYPRVHLQRKELAL